MFIVDSDVEQILKVTTAKKSLHHGNSLIFRLIGGPGRKGEGKVSGTVYENVYVLI
jgi:hypothetical protein